VDYDENITKTYPYQFLLKSCRNRGRKTIIRGFVVWLFLLTNIQAAIRIYDYWLWKTTGKGDRIVDAIETYKKLNGTYPDRLDQLVPDFLPEKPVTEFPFATTRFVYHLQEEGFSLEFFAGETMKSACSAGPRRSITRCPPAR